MGSAARLTSTTWMSLSNQAMMDLISRGLLQDLRAYEARGRDSSQPLLGQRFQISQMGRSFVGFISDADTATNSGTV